MNTPQLPPLTKHTLGAPRRTTPINGAIIALSWVIAPCWVVALSTACGEQTEDPGEKPGEDASADAATNAALVPDSDALEGTQGEQADAANAATGKPTWYGNVGQLVMTHCASCHGEGGIGPFRLDRPNDWKTMGPIAWNAIKAGTMPPFMADPSCGKFAHIRALSDADKATFEAWLKADQPLGVADPANVAKIPVFAKLEKTHSAPMPKPYTPTLTKQDDYRCFLLDHEFNEDTYLLGSQVVPGAKELVHHVLVYALTGKQRTDAEAAEAKSKDPKMPGYSCFGGPLPSSGGGNILNDFAGGFPVQLAAWVPGLEPTVRPKGTGTRIPKGARIVMQVHYNLVAGKTVTDTTRIDMILSTDKPKNLLATRPLLIHDLNILPNQTTAHQRLFRYYGKNPLIIRSLTPHMHLLGSEFRATVVRADKSEECGLEVPNWDFQWQQGYGRPVDAPLVLNDGDGIQLRCVYNNKAENQPMVDGKQMEPKTVKWGDGSFDEMCMLYLDMSHPYSDPPAHDAKACEGFEDCEANCKKDGRFDCIMSCKEVAARCQTCAIGEVVSCASTKCPLALLGAQSCLTRCLVGAAILDSNPGACLKAECGDKYEAARECLDTALLTKGCTTKLAKCGL